MAHRCRVCGNETGNRELFPQERMFGIGESFPYFECGACGCLQIVDFPADMARHYPQNYYSFTKFEPPAGGAWRRKLKELRAKKALAGEALAERLLSPFASFPGDIRLWMRLLGATQESRLLDVGCGGGTLLRRLATFGFTRLTGVDPFIDADLAYPDGVRVVKARLEDLPGQFDGIMMHHSFEHMPDQVGILKELHRLLAPNGKVLVRIPLCSSEAFRTYGIEWSQLDPPRHFYLHTEKSMRLAAKLASFDVTNVVYDSTSYQFWGSEQCRQGIAVRSERSYAVNPGASLFTADDMARFERQAAELNERGDGDQACFVLNAAPAS